VILLIVIGGYGAAVYFNDQLAPYLPQQLWPFIWYNPPPPKPVDVKKDDETPEHRKERLLRAAVLESEWRAFGYTTKDEFDAGNKELKLGSGGATKPPENVGTGTGGAK
jgi:hypothetical protein